ncbi:MAG: antitoxin Xre/MbcA/ParS toxin-binding domain-containing protein [Leeuwenhoekiella sp.]
MNAIDTQLAGYLYPDHNEISEILNEPSIDYGTLPGDKMLMVQAIKQGLSLAFFNLVKSNSPFNDEEWSRFLDISKRSLDRFKAAKNHVFKSIQSEKIIELAGVAKLGVAVFGNKNNFNDWLHTPSFALGNNKPIDLLGTSPGRELVERELYAIEHGVFV